MERMEEEIPESECRAYQHFISNSEWDHQGLMQRLAYDASELFAANQALKGFPTGYIIDESASRHGRTAAAHTCIDPISGETRDEWLFYFKERLGLKVQRFRGEGTPYLRRLLFSGNTAEVQYSWDNKKEILLQK